MILVTGGCGFIGSNFVIDHLATSEEPLVVLDQLTYAGHLENLKAVKHNPHFIFVQGSINDHHLVSQLFAQYQPRALINFAAETHVDRSIDSPGIFIKTNIEGTFTLLEVARAYAKTHNNFRFLHISTDEVYGELSQDAKPFLETTAYHPNNPYAASKAAADHLVKAYYRTYGLPILITHCSNNYGPYQFPEKLIPLTLMNALSGKPIGLYGDGGQIRDWLYVIDHCHAIQTVLAKGEPGETYNIGGQSECTNLTLVTTLCQLLDEYRPRSTSYQSLITFIPDRPGHDRRYAIDASKIKTELHWCPTETLVTGLRKTVLWYFTHATWLNAVCHPSVESTV